MIEHRISTGGMSGTALPQDAPAGGHPASRMICTRRALLASLVHLSTFPLLLEDAAAQDPDRRSPRHPVGSRPATPAINASANASASGGGVPVERSAFPGTPMGTWPIIRTDTGQQVGRFQVNFASRDRISNVHQRDTFGVHLLDLAADRLNPGVAIATRPDGASQWTVRDTFVNRAGPGDWVSFDLVVISMVTRCYSMRFNLFLEDARPNSPTNGARISCAAPAFVSISG